MCYNMDESLAHRMSMTTTLMGVIPLLWRRWVLALHCISLHLGRGLLANAQVWSRISVMATPRRCTSIGSITGRSGLEIQWCTCWVLPDVQGLIFRGAMRITG
jgi:hypothetical protein